MQIKKKTNLTYSILQLYEIILKIINLEAFKMLITKLAIVLHVLEGEGGEP